MRKPLTLTAALLLGLAVVPTATLLFGGETALAADAKKNTVSPALAKNLKAAQDAITKKNYPDALAKLQELDKAPNHSPYDNYVIANFYFQVYVGQKDYAQAISYMEQVVNSGFVDPAELPKMTRSLAEQNYQLKNYEKAIEYGNRAIKLGGGTDEFSTLVGQAYYLKGDYKGTLSYFTGVVDADEKEGKVPKEQTLKIMLSACSQLKDSTCETRQYERLVAHYPKPEYWQNLIYSLRKSSNASDDTTFNIDLLAAEVGALVSSDYAEMAQIAMDMALPGDAASILQKGFAKGVFTDQRDKDKYTRLLAAATKQADADKLQLASEEKEADAAKSGDPDVKVGYAYLSYDMYDKAVAAIQHGLAKGGVKNPDEAQILLGVAELKMHNRDQAIKDFKSAKSDPNMARLAALWVIHAQQA
jgi:hypothetical protein